MVKGVYDVYQFHGSPNASLENSRKRLDKVRSRLQEITPQRREEFEIAARMNTSNGGTIKSIENLEEQLEECVLLTRACDFKFKFTVHVSSLSDTLCRLTKWYEHASVLDRHLPCTQYRLRVVNFENKVKALLDDTWVNNSSSFS
jgi:hypothetical protein